jgi:hypothetical protein
MSATLVEPGTAPPPPRPRPRTRHRWVPLLLVLIGVGVLVYPVIATEYNNVRQQEFADSYRQQVESAGPDALAADLARAREYNAGLPGVPILDPWLTSAQSGSAASTCRCGTAPPTTPSTPGSGTCTAPPCRSAGRAATRCSPGTPACPTPPSSTG